MSAVVATDEPIALSTALAPAAAERSRLFPASANAIVLNYLAAASLLVIGFAFYSTVPYYTELLTPLGIVAIEVVLVGYLLALPVFYATFPDDYAVKCRLFWRAVANLHRRWPTEKEAVALRAVAVKMFFMPLMIAWLGTGAISLIVTIAHPEALSFYELMLAFIIIVDLFFFTTAYGVEHPRLKNEIRSVEPTVLGWAVALACYPPFQLASVWALGWYPAEFPDYDRPEVRAAVGTLMLTLMGVYTWASVSLGLKASNLTNRGTVSHGPYAYIRHPAYLCKNLFWWVSATPLLIARAAAGDAAGFGLIVLSLVVWSGIYTVRALTEEWHLRRDPEYRDYCTRVRYRYIPGVW